MMNRNNTRFLNWVWRKLLNLFIHEQWFIMIGKYEDYHSLPWNNLTPIMPPNDKFWADPFPWHRDDQYYVFFEEYIYKLNKGVISCIIFDKNSEIISKLTVLERPYHLSYPFLFEFHGDIYMIPETKANKGIELYKCIQFPHHWKFEKKLIENIKAVDATLFQHNNKWWLFTNVEDIGSSWDSLYLYYADHPLSTNWTPHPKNPIINNIKLARPAGRIFFDNGYPIRPSQDCSLRYGYAINFNKIEILSDSEYEETRLFTLIPSKKRRIIATHTYNFVDNILTIDGIHRRLKFLKN